MEQQTLFKVRDKRKKGWFYLDNEYLNGIGKYLGPIGIAVYVSLCRHADEDQKCFPSQKTIAEEIGAGERSVRRYLKKLEELNVIQPEKKRLRQSRGQWLNNVYYLLDKTEWKYPEATGASGKPEATDDTARGHRRHSQRPQWPLNNTHNNNTHNNNTNSNYTIVATPEGVAEMERKDKDIFELINLFKKINPSYERLFSNKTQRLALSRLLKKLGREKVEHIIGVLERTNVMPFAPIITTPLQLESKLGDLIAFIQKERSKIHQMVKL